ncbi:MAG: hypothetical protein J0I68_09665 [Achromobacter sp.]|jgi:hypothetical protein|uniref:SH3b domain-containing protein n=1 Tax=Achromobacter insuavis TaxID=1287735 RepID=A0A6J5A3C6_9BURK|nr:MULTISPECIES: hypothetical protein [Achromobacter]MBN9638796.1 hypothetical protein [Achromobacter sp.]MCG2598896.1 hypothetical protein [Achromobacter sp.]MCG2603287.1 hypothetical protein [Achromobacter sp.]CAB3633093.1 hypothetical protein LMG26845_01061 [Achromobacter insuavis]CAB3866203.1 hypothetical protein LMG26846_02755 [Achromobacter insuavis]
MIQPSSMIAAALAALALYGAPALAADQIVGASLKPLPLYAQPGGGTPAAQSDGQGMPWPVLESREEFYRVKVNGADYWVDSMQVRVARNSSAQCGPVVKRVPGPTGSTAGAGENACR